MRWILISLLLLTCIPVDRRTDGSESLVNELKVLSNNVGIFPAHVQSLYRAKLKEKKQKILTDEEQRAVLLAQSLLDFTGDPDVVLLQEIWSIKARGTC